MIANDSKKKDQDIKHEAEMLRSLNNLKERSVCKLQKALYGLKQSSRQWHSKLSRKLDELNFISSPVDPRVYTQCSDNSKTIITIYVDDLIIVSNDTNKVNEVKAHLKESFEMKDMGTLKHCLGIEFKYKDSKIQLSQRKYIEDLIRKFNMETCNPVTTPIAPGTKLSKYEDGEKKFGCLPYQSLIGSLMYLSVATRPDIAYTISYLSQFNTCYAKDH